MGRFRGLALLGVVTVLVAAGLYLLLRDSDEPGEKAQRALGQGSSDAAAVPYDPHDRLLPPECDPRRVATVVMQFFEVANREGAGAIRFIAAEPEFRTYVVGEGLGPREVETKSRAEVGPYLERRHDVGERLRLLEMAVGEVAPDFARRPTGGPGGRAPIAAFDLTVSRREGADRAVVGSGKSAINCSTGKIFMWTMSFGTAPPGALTCPKSTVGPTRTSAVACAPGYQQGVSKPVAVSLPGNLPG